MSNNPVNHKTAKHIAVKHHFIREKVQSGETRVEYIRTTEIEGYFYMTS